jgi:hypothetical protein
MHKLVVFALLTLSPPALFGVVSLCHARLRRRSEGRTDHQESREL